MKNKKTDKSLISVIMPVFNTEKYVKEAIKSIQKQTYSNWELIVVDDGSIDTSFTIIQKLAKKDPRIKLLKHDKNMGIAEAVNEALSHSQGDYIARMDADDISLPNRLKKQLEFLENNKNIGIIGSFMFEMNKNKEIIAGRKVPLTHNQISQNMFTTQTIQNPTCMFRKSLIPKDQIWYDRKFSPVDDLDFFFRLLKYVKFANIPEYLVIYRKHDKNSTLRNIKNTFNLTLKVRMKAIYEYGYKTNLKQYIIHVLQGIAVYLLPNNILYNVFKLWKNDSTNQKINLTELKSCSEKKFSLSLIIPVYKAESFIEENIIRLIRFLNQECSNFELIVVVDGFVDKTFEILQKMQRKYKKLKVFGYEKNVGKGYAVRYGMIKAKNKYTGFIDAGTDINFYSLYYMIQEIKRNPDYDVFTADKTHPFSFCYDISLLRKIYSYIFKKLTNILLLTNFTDTQAGLKIFKTDLIQSIIPTLPRLINGFSFDVEIIKEIVDHGYKIKKCPIIITKEVRNSTVNSLHIIKMVFDLCLLSSHYHTKALKPLLQKLNPFKRHEIKLST